MRQSRLSSSCVSFVSLCVLCVLLSCACDPPAQLYEIVGIRAQGMGGAFIAVADDATATWWNPAGIAAVPFFNAVDRVTTASGGPAAGDALTAVSLAFPALGLSYYRLPHQSNSAADLYRNRSQADKTAEQDESRSRCSSAHGRSIPREASGRRHRP